MNIHDQPLVSVVIPCYNHVGFVQKSIKSVIDQLYVNIELIIIDDGSSDGSIEKILQSKGLKILVKQLLFIRKNPPIFLILRL